MTANISSLNFKGHFFDIAEQREESRIHSSKWAVKSLSACVLLKDLL